MSISNTLERRYTTGAVQTRAAADGKRIGGYAAKFNRTSQDLGGFIERLNPGFFAKSAADGWPGVMSRYNHTELLGTTAARSLRLAVDGTGLDYETDLLDDPLSARVFALVQRGDVSQSSFAFYLAPGGDDWSLTDDGFPLRTLISGKLVDVAPVDQPAYLDTSTGLRTLAEKRGVELGEVKGLARDNHLADLLKAPAKVIDLARRSEVVASGRVQSLRRMLEMKRPM